MHSGELTTAFFKFYFKRSLGLCAVGAAYFPPIKQLYCKEKYPGSYVERTPKRDGGRSDATDFFPQSALHRISNKTDGFMDSDIKCRRSAKPDAAYRGLLVNN